jgi:hypothetical protein
LPRRAAYDDRVRAALVLALAIVASCAAPRAPSREAPASWTYAIDPPRDHSTLLGVEATFGAASRAVAPPETRAAVRSFEARTPSGFRPVAATEQGWRLDDCTSPCTVRYTIDLAALVEACGRELDCGTRVNDSILAPAARWLVRPAGSVDAPVTVRARAGGPFALGLRRGEGGAYAFRSSELDESSYTAFGPMRTRRAEPLDIALLDRPLAMDDDALTKWIGEARGVIADFFGRFPTPATIFVVPVRGERVRFGSVSARTGASVALFVGDTMPASQTHDDWVLVHELFHLGTPTFVGEGRWLEEGLATYYEPILRTRAGWMTERDLWTHFADQMRRGVREEGSAPSIEDRHDIDSTYWGGALFAMLADVRIRERTRGAHSLDDALRAVLAKGGDVTHVWGVRDFLAYGDALTGTQTLRELHEAFLRGEVVELAKELDSLGVVWSEGKPAELVAGMARSEIRVAIGKAPARLPPPPR